MTYFRYKLEAVIAFSFIFSYSLASENEGKSNSSGDESSSLGELPAYLQWDSSGYIFFCLCMGKQLIETIYFLVFEIIAVVSHITVICYVCRSPLLTLNLQNFISGIITDYGIRNCNRCILLN